MSLKDTKYYEAIPPRSVAERLLITARDRIYADFIREMRPAPTDRILDVGISDVLNDAANVLERKYPHPEQITACGIGEAVEFQQAFPAVRYVKIEPNVRLPFPMRAFDIATANAVLEHVGSPENQAFFVSELCRVAKRVFITVPHRYFPIEHHTALPLVHYFDRTFRRACSLVGKEPWANSENLILMSRRRLRELVPNRTRKVSVGYTGLRLGPLSSNLFLAAS
ncbi:MAG TPA: class I SAM-dependent methyltransferase [Beijerinckiaceae bacterium]|jgi:hypothetical protein